MNNYVLYINTQLFIPYNTLLTMFYNIPYWTKLLIYYFNFFGLHSTHT